MASGWHLAGPLGNHWMQIQENEICNFCIDSQIELGGGASPSSLQKQTNSARGDSAAAFIGKIDAHFMCQGAESRRRKPASQKMVSLYSSIHLLFDWTFCILNSSCSAAHGYYDALAQWEIMKVMGFYSNTLQRRRPQPHPSLHQLASV